jgi:hypothetical protein
VGDMRHMGRKKVTVNVKITMDEYNKFTFTEHLEKIKEVKIRKPKLVIPYAFPSLTSPKCCEQW